jgi:hypothetical protein
MSIEIITGEKIQQLCDLYLGFDEDFNYNPIIKNQFYKHKNLHSINYEFDNPKIIFCYSHRINYFSKKIDFFINPFILISHNSDGCIDYDNINVNYILNNKLLIKWFCQNLSFKNNKLHLIPIGIANSMWEHGNLSLFYNTSFINNIKKSKVTYYNFNIHTNIEKRQICYETLKDKIEWLNTINPYDNLIRLSEYKFCICPEGNGYDTHRLWECLYLKVVPIVKKSNFTQILKDYNIPILILDHWNDYDETKLNYDNYNFNNEIFTLHNFDKLKQIIFSFINDSK